LVTFGRKNSRKIASFSFCAILVRKPCVLILDEATSALDAASEHLVQEALDNIQKEANMTILLIAHRLSTVKNADQIVVIDKGKYRNFFVCFFLENFSSFGRFLGRLKPSATHH